jgi:hypothetical protein
MPALERAEEPSEVKTRASTNRTISSPTAIARRHRIRDRGASVSLMVTAKLDDCPERHEMDSTGRCRRALMQDRRGAFLEQGGKSLAGIEHARLHSSFRNPENGRNFRDRLAVVVDEIHHLGVRRGQLQQPPPQELGITFVL